MRALIQRVSKAVVTVDQQAVGEIGRGLVILLGVTHEDQKEQARWLAEKIANLRIFEDEDGKFNHSLLEVGGSALVVSQFTLYGDSRKGRRPSFTDAARPEAAQPMVEFFAAQLEKLGVEVAAGLFGARMMVEIHNDGPVTFWLDR